MSGETAEVLEERLRALADEAGNPLSAEAIRALAETLAGALSALGEAERALDASEEPPAMRPVLADEPGTASASARG